MIKIGRKREYEVAKKSYLSGVLLLPIIVPND